MAKLHFTTLELSDIQKVFEDVIERKLSIFKKEEPKKLKLLTRKETANLLCISLPTLNDWTKKGIINAYRIGNRVLYKIDEINGALSRIKSSKRREGLSC